MEAPELSVVIPTRDRARSLERCLDSLVEGIIRSGRRVEVVVADDCSTDRTAEVIASHPTVKAVRLDRSLGSGAARNAALDEALAPLILFIDDDIVTGERLIERHLEHHLRHPQPEEAMVGLVTWTRASPITPHMRWLERGGPLFAFDTIEDPESIDPSHFCTANASVKAELLARVEGPFDPRLRRFTDVELGARLARWGMRLRFDREAVGWHLRSDDPASTDRRMRAVGVASVQLDRIHPGLAPPAGPDTLRASAKATLARALSPVAPFLPDRLADRIWSARAAWAYAEGRREAEGRRSG